LRSIREVAQRRRPWAPEQPGRCWSLVVRLLNSRSRGTRGWSFRFTGAEELEIHRRALLFVQGTQRGRIGGSIARGDEAGQHRERDAAGAVVPPCFEEGNPPHAAVAAISSPYFSVRLGVRCVYVTAAVRRNAYSADRRRWLPAEVVRTRCSVKCPLLRTNELPDPPAILVKAASLCHMSAKLIVSPCSPRRAWEKNISSCYCSGSLF
jgi:hypothetical protein